MTRASRIRRAFYIGFTGWKGVSLFGCAFALFLGCGEKPVKLVPVHGKVLVEDQAVKSGTVSFRPDFKRGNETMEQPAGKLREDGSFELFSTGRAGAPPGWYRVLVMADNFQVVQPPPSPVWPDYPEGYLPKTLVHERYLYFNQTDIMVEVKEDPQQEDYVLRLNP